MSILFQADMAGVADGTNFVTQYSPLWSLASGEAKIYNESLRNGQYGGALTWTGGDLGLVRATKMKITMNAAGNGLLSMYPMYVGVDANNLRFRHSSGAWQVLKGFSMVIQVADSEPYATRDILLWLEPLGSDNYRIHLSINGVETTADVSDSKWEASTPYRLGTLGSTDWAYFDDIALAIDILDLQGTTPPPNEIVVYEFNFEDTLLTKDSITTSQITSQIFISEGCSFSDGYQQNSFIDLIVAETLLRDDLVLANSFSQIDLSESFYNNESYATPLNLWVQISDAHTFNESITTKLDAISDFEDSLQVSDTNLGNSSDYLYTFNESRLFSESFVVTKTINVGVEDTHSFVDAHGGLLSLLSSLDESKLFTTSFAFNETFVNIITNVTFNCKTGKATLEMHIPKMIIQRGKV